MTRAVSESLGPRAAAFVEGRESGREGDEKDGKMEFRNKDCEERGTEAAAGDRGRLMHGRGKFRLRRNGGGARGKEARR